jgi:hypothetical protein
MANDFKRFTKPNVGTNTGASADAVYSVPAGAGSTALESIVIGIYCQRCFYTCWFLIGSHVW